MDGEKGSDIPELPALSEALLDILGWPCLPARPDPAGGGPEGAGAPSPRMVVRSCMLKLRSLSDKAPCPWAQHRRDTRQRPDHVPGAVVGEAPQSQQEALPVSEVGTETQRDLLETLRGKVGTIPGPLRAQQGLLWLRLLPPLRRPRGAADRPGPGLRMWPSLQLCSQGLTAAPQVYRPKPFLQLSVLQCLVRKSEPSNNMCVPSVLFSQERKDRQYF